MLGQFLAEPPATSLLAVASRLEGGDGALGTSLRTVAASSAATSERQARREYDALFIGVARGELVPYASFYLTGFLHERPLARLRSDMARLGFTRKLGRSDPEDHIASICEMMAALIEAGRDVSVQADFFDAHLGRWADSFFNDLRQASSARLYAAVGAVGQLLIDLDRTAFALTNAPQRGAA